jgi:hypothetical protein
MPAPNTAYLNNGNALRMSEEDLAGGVLANYDALIAAYIYGAGDIKNLFYLDAITEVQITDDAGNIIQTGFIGLAKINGFNYNQHSQAKRFKGSLLAVNDVGVPIDDYVAFNDGGLNTLGKVSFEEILATSIASIQVFATFISSYYASSTAYGFRYRNFQAGGSGGWIEQNLQPAQGTLAQQGDSDNGSSPIGGQKGVIIEFQGFITNSEGTHYGNSFFVTPTGVLVSLREGSFSASPVNFYIDDLYINTVSNGNAVRLYSNQDFTGYQNLGGIRRFYTAANIYYTYGYDVGANDYLFLDYIDETAAIPPMEFQYRGYSEFSQTDADNQVIYDDMTNMGSLWFNSSNSTWHVSYAGTSPSFSFGSFGADGYYSAGDVSGVTDQLYIINGVQQ